MRLSQKWKWLVSLTTVFFGLGCLSLGMAQNNDDLPLYEENSLYVKYKDNSDICAMKLRPKNGERNVRTVLLGISDRVTEYFHVLPEAVSMSLFENPVLERTFLIQTDPDYRVNLDQLMEELKKNPEVEFVERVPLNRILSTGTPKSAPVNDPYYGMIQAGNIKMNVSWHLDMINAEKAWQIQKGDSNIIVAVVDNAIWADHEDLNIPTKWQYNCATRVAGNSAPPVSSATQNQQCDEAMIYGSTCTTYDFSHGTHCAGAIGAINNNGKGIASIGGGVSLMGVAGPSVSAPNAIVGGYVGITWAAEKGAHVISCSWGGEGSSSVERNVVKSCYDKGIIVVAAAGNNYTDKPCYPAAYTPYVISVGSVDADKKKSSFSNFGYWVDMLSPGGEDTTSYSTQIFSTTFCQNQYTRIFGKTDFFNGQYYDEMSGTSMATPVLAGVVGLLKSKNKNITTDQARYILQTTGQNLSNKDSRLNGYCRVVDAYAALVLLAQNPEFGAPISKTGISAKSKLDTVWLSWTAPETTGTIKGYRIYRDGDSINEVTDLSFLDTNVLAGTHRYGIQPIYKNTYAVVTEFDVFVKSYYRIKALVRPTAECGSVEGVGSYEAQQVFKLNAIPAEGYLFDYWMDERGTKSYNKTFTGQVAQNRQLFAFFKKDETPNEKQNLTANALRLSPNPATDEVKVSCTDYDLKHIRVTDMNGRVVYEADADGHEQTIRTATWGKGTYVVGVTTSAGFAARKLVKR